VTTGQSRLSACIITYNEADRVEACLRSVSFCDELVVVDSHSTDSTRDIARSLGARVIERDWPGYRSQKQFAVDTASGDWVLCLRCAVRSRRCVRADSRNAPAGRCRGLPTTLGDSFVMATPTRIV
jgi:glycosyltransferase involved in cell wall biosynthesis